MLFSNGEAGKDQRPVGMYEIFCVAIHDIGQQCDTEAKRSP